MSASAPALKARALLRKRRSQIQAAAIVRDVPQPAAEPTPPKQSEQSKPQDKQGKKNRKRKQLLDQDFSARPAEKKSKPGPDQPAAVVASGGGLSQLQNRMQKQLQGAQFRFLNEQLYTSNSKSAVQLFKEDPRAFEVYHVGFRSQAESWPVNPVDVFVRMLKKRPGVTVGDFGCGEAMLALQLVASAKKVHSFDLVALNDRVTSCDISNVPLEAETLDVAVFSLSLMGTNWLEFVAEAHRVLCPGGHLLVAEVRSRFGVDDSGTDDANIKKFVSEVAALGFRFKKEILKNKIFVILEFTKLEAGGKSRKNKNREKMDSATATEEHQQQPVAGRRADKPSKFQFKPCLYKRR